MRDDILNFPLTFKRSWIAIQQQIQGSPLETVECHMHLVINKRCYANRVSEEAKSLTSVDRCRVPRLIRGRITDKPPPQQRCRHSNNHNTPPILLITRNKYNCDGTTLMTIVIKESVGQSLSGKSLHTLHNLLNYYAV